MKDFRHLFCGYLGAVIALTLYVLLWANIQRCAGAEALPQSGDVVQIGDHRYVVISHDDWTRWTNAVARLEAVAERRWTKEHQTEEGRRAWHGAKVKSELVEDGRVKVTTYADGFVWTEQVPQARRVSPAVRATKANMATPPRADIPARLRAKRNAERNKAPREVNVTFGPGGKVLKVEDAK